MQHEWTLYVFDALMMVVVLSFSVRSYGLFKQSGSYGKLSPKDCLVVPCEQECDESELQHLPSG